jgi:transposase
MERFVLTDAQWAKMEPHCLGKPGDPGWSGKNNRLFVEAVLWIARTGSPWRDLQAAFGHWSSVFTRLRDWAKADVWKRLFEAVSDDPTWNTPWSDATIVKIHRHGQGAKGGLKAIGRSKGGMTTKILALTDALGNLVRFVLLPGQRFDTVGVPPRIEGLAFDALIADKAFDSNAIIAELDARGAKVVISQHPRRAKPLAIDEEMYKMAALLRKAQGVQTHRHARRQDRSELCLHDPSGRRRDKLLMNPNRP